MKHQIFAKKVLFAAVLCFLSVGFVTAQQDMQQIHNAGFELWEGSGDNVEPVDWSSFMTTECPVPFYLSLLQFKQIEPSNETRPGSTGTKSARIFARDASMMGYVITANGNVTTGRIYAQDVDLSLAGNKTKRDENGFNHPFTARPDSITFWVRNHCVNPQQDAYVNAVIHDNTDYFVPLTGLDDFEHAVGVATKRFQSEGNQWVRQSAAFDYSNYQSNDPQYMLLYFNTNVVAAEGDPNDEMFIDDILLIYHPEVSVNDLESTTYTLYSSLETPIIVPFTLAGTMSPENLNAEPNVVTAQLSDANGSFDQPIILGTLTTNESGIIDGNIPVGTPAGTGYRVRVVTSNYPMISEDNGFDLNLTEDACEVVLVADPQEGGSVYGGGIFDCGTEIEVEAVPTPNYRFTCWTNLTDTISTERFFSLTATGNQTLVAHFANEAIDELPSTDFRVYGSRQQIVVEAERGGNVMIYNMLGQLIRQTTISQGTTTIAMPHNGLYLVRVNGIVWKVVL